MLFDFSKVVQLRYAVKFYIYIGQVLRGLGAVMPPGEGGCLTGVFGSLIIFSLWNRVVTLMAKWDRASTGRGVQGVPKAI